MENPYQPIKTKIKKIITETSNIKTFVLELEENLSFETGQFMEVTVPGLGEAPFTPSSNPKDKDSLEFTIMNVGRVTKVLHDMIKDQDLGVRGPYGKGYPMDKFRGKEILIVGGGVGLAPLRSLLYALFNNVEKYAKIDLRYGAKTPDEIVYRNEIDAWSEKAKNVEVTLTVDKGDKGWKGNVGVVTTILKGIKVGSDSLSIVCGPPIMMKFATLKLLELGYKPEQIYLSMEKNMSCGIGKCGHCRIGNFYACKDGPVFSYDMIKDFENIWD